MCKGGYLLKKNSQGKWQRRYLVAGLNGHRRAPFIYYSHSAKDATRPICQPIYYDGDPQYSSGSFHVEGVGASVFQIRAPVRTYQFAAESEAEMAAWVYSLRCFLL